MTDELRKKLLAYEPEPPEGLWQRIADGVATDPLQAISERLLQFEATPPPQAWDKINEGLDLAPAKPGVINLLSPKYRRYSVGAAAALLAIVALSYVFRSASYNATKTPDTTPSYKEQSILPAFPPPVASPDNAAKHPSAAEKTSHSTSATSRVVAAARRLALRVLPRRPESQPAIDVVSSPKTPAQPALHIDQSKEERFMVYTDSNGRSVLLPKKLFEYIHCGQDNEDCKKRIQLLQHKLTDRGLNTDFTGVLEILSQLQENQ